MPQTIDNMSVTWTNSLTTYTGIKLNAAGSSDANSAAGSLLMDLQVGGTSRFQVRKDGRFGGSSDNIISVGGRLDFTASNLVSASLNAANFNLSAATLSFTSSSGGANSGDLILGRRAAANLRLGAADTTGTTAPTAQTLSVQSWTSSTNNNQPGANFTIAGSQGTGTGAGGSIIFQVAPAGAVSNGVQNALADALTIDSTRSVYIERYFRTRLNIFAILDDGNNSIQMGQNVTLGWTAGGAYGPSPDVILRRDAANTLALRNGANAQAFNIYKTYTNDTTYERFSISYNTPGGTWELGSRFSNGGATSVSLVTQGAGDIILNTNYVSRWTVNGGTGHFLAAVDNTYDIGATSGGRPRTLYVGTSVLIQGTNGEILTPFVSIRRNVTGGTALCYLYADANNDGNLIITNSTTNGFNLLKFGGTTSSFPAIKRSSTTLQARLADDSGFASVQGKITTDTAYTAGDPTTTGYLVVYDSAGVAYKIPAVAV